MPGHKWTNKQRTKFITTMRKRKYSRPAPVPVEKPPIPEIFKYEGQDDGTGGTLLFVDGLRLRRLRLQTVRAWIAEEISE